MPDFKGRAIESSTAPRPGDLKVMIVEDEPRLREMLLRAVREMGFISSGSRTGEEAMRMMEGDACDVLMVDLNLPGMSGMELIEQVKKRRPRTQAIVLTGFGDLETAKQAIHFDVVDFLTKPCPLGEIETALDRARRKLAPISPVAAMAEEDEGGNVATMSMGEVERKHILAALERHGGNRAAAAAELGISVRKLYYRLAQYQEHGQ